MFCFVIYKVHLICFIMFYCIYHIELYLYYIVMYCILHYHMFRAKLSQNMYNNTIFGTISFIMLDYFYLNFYILILIYIFYFLFLINDYQLLLLLYIIHFKILI